MFRFEAGCADSPAPGSPGDGPAQPVREILPQPRFYASSVPRGGFSAETLQALQQSADAGAELACVEDTDTCAPAAHRPSLVPMLVLAGLIFAATR